MFSQLDMLQDLLNPYETSYALPRQRYDYYRNPPHVHLNIIRPRRQTNLNSTGAYEGKTDPSKFQVMLNVKHFRPDEINVKTVDNYVVIHGQHEEQADQHGFVSREFTRRYELPDDVEPESVTSSLSQDGVLTIQAPRKSLPPPKNERIVPITLQQPAAVEEAQKHELLKEQQASQQASEEQK